VANASGTIAASGAGTLFQQGGTFDEGLGSITGEKPVILESAALSYTGKGMGKIMLRGTSSLTGAVSAGQALVLYGLCGVNTSVTAGSFVNSGTIDFTSETCEPYVRLDLAGGTLENKGTLNIENATGGERAIEGSLVNEKTLYLGGARLDVSGAFKQQGKKAVFETLIASSEYGALTATGAATITGELEIKQVKKYVPAKGQTYELLKTLALSGTFSKVKKNKIKKSPYSYVPHYSSTGVTLVVEA
jgi:cytoskeletal protein CcmA (bactofilin family)